MASEEYRVYGYVTNSKVKLLLVVGDSVNQVDPRNFLKRVHRFLVESILNPFHVVDSPLTDCKRFDALVCQEVEAIQGR